MPDAVQDFLSGTHWASWARTPLAGDASARRYERLTDGTRTAILMIAPPETCGPLSPFLTIAGVLRNAGLAAPEIQHAAETAGLAVIEDLGPEDFAKRLRTDPAQEVALYRAAADILAGLHDQPAPPGLPVLTPQVGAEMLAPFFEAFRPDTPGHQRALIETAISDALTALDPWPMTFSLRDFHAENLIWRPDRTGTDRVGLLDFQDAFVAPAGYDLVSLLRDARRDVSVQAETETIRAFAGQTGLDPQTLDRAIATLSVQRNLRILGIFSRLAAARGKPGYLALPPRVLGHIRRDLTHPARADLAKARAGMLEDA